MGRMSIKEFRALGFLQELNRCFLHTLGLALEVEVDEDGNERFGGVWLTDDPEGFCFDELDAEKVHRVRTRAEEYGAARMKALGYTVQPLNCKEDD